ncbi:hypothetical protein [Hyalangium sp.]|uniref:hypothetical protein n=1 Tax=Hyalangium sp. TaxID=2028555 RepID=UPI00389A54B1
MATLLPTATGLISIGGPALCRLTPGARRWEPLHEVPGDDLYRVTADDSGRLLAAWSKEPLIHFITPGQTQVVSFPKPQAPADVQNFQIADLAFSPDGRHALVFMTGTVTLKTDRYQGPSRSTAVYRVPLAANAAGTLLFRVDHGYQLDGSPHGAVFAMPKDPTQKCDQRECRLAEIVAYEITPAGVNRKTLFRADELEVRGIKGVRVAGDQELAVLLDVATARRLELLRWRYGDAKPTRSPRPFPPDYDRTRFLLTRSGRLIELRVRSGLIELWEGEKQLANLGELQKVDEGLHGFGERRDGTLWLHWGDHVGLISPGKPPRSYPLASLLPRRSEWAGSDVYAGTPEQLWVGIDDSNRHYVRVDFADIEKRAIPWPPGTLQERIDSEYAGYDPKDTSTSDRLNNAATLRQMAGGLFSIGGGALRQLRNGERRWRTLHAIPKDNLYRVAADDSGRILAAWEQDPHIHFFSNGQHVTFPKPAAGSATTGESHLEHLSFLPNGREALVIMSGQVKAPPSRSVPEPVRFYYSSWTTEAYRLSLDGSAEPKLLFREDFAYRLYESKRGVVFAMPKYPGQECADSTCMPIVAIVAYEITDSGIKKHTLLGGDGFGANVYLSQAALVRGSNDERLALVVRLTKNEGKLWPDGGRGLVRWRWGDAKGDYRPLPNHSSLGPQWLLTRDNDFIELVEHWDEKPDRLEIRRYLAKGGEQSTSIHALRKMSQVYGLGERADGGLWLHWGDHLGLLSADQPPRSFDLDPLVQRGTEWAGATTYVKTPESLWVGLDGRGRSYVRVDLAEAEKRAKPWR